MSNFVASTESADVQVLLCRISTGTVMSVRHFHICSGRYYVCRWLSTVWFLDICIYSDNQTLVPYLFKIGTYETPNYENVLQHHRRITYLWIITQRTRDVMITSLLRQNDVVTLFWRNNDVIIVPCVHWAWLWWVNIFYLNHGENDRSLSKPIMSYFNIYLMSQGR